MRWISEIVITNNLKAVLAEKRLTHSWLADQLHVHPKVVAAWCENVRQPDGITAFRLMKVLELSSFDDPVLWNETDRIEDVNSQTNHRPKN